MKKLMIAAAVAAMTAGAFAGDPCTQPCPFGYQIKVALKTTSTLSVSNQTTACEAFCFRGPASRRLAGFVFGNTSVDDSDPCGGTGCNCNAWGEGAKLAMWNYDTKQAANFEAMTGIQLDRIFSRKLDTSMVEIAFDLDDLRFAGFGYAAKRDGKWTIKNLAGFCAGTLPQKCTTCSSFDPCTGACEDTAEAVVKVWGICDDESLAPAIESENTVAYGKWTIDWSATVYNKVLDKTLSVDANEVQPGSDWGKATPIAFAFN